MMWVNAALAFLPSLTVWIVASHFLATFIYRTETRRPELVGRTPWHAVETSLIFLVFVGSVGIWIGLIYLLQHVNH